MKDWRLYARLFTSMLVIMLAGCIAEKEPNNTVKRRLMRITSSYYSLSITHNRTVSLREPTLISATQKRMGTITG
jgi:hypothetical protein